MDSKLHMYSDLLPSGSNIEYKLINFKLDVAVYTKRVFEEKPEFRNFHVTTEKPIVRSILQWS